MNKVHTHNNPPLRPYQQEGSNILIRDLIHYMQSCTSESLGEGISDRVAQIQNLRTEESTDRPSHDVGLVDMTMGSGKTHVLGEFLRRTLRLRNKFAPKKTLNILVLSDRINLVDQLEWDLISGRYGKDGILKNVINTSKILANKTRANTQRIHSQNSDRDTVLQSTWDNIVFSTIQSVEHIKGEWNIIIVDEADSVLTSKNKEILMRMTETQKTSPYIVGFTGTVDENLVDLLGHPLFSYDIDEYLRSPYSPDIDYNLMTANKATGEEVWMIHTLINNAQNEKDIPKKKKLDREIREEIEWILARFDGYESVVHHLVHDSWIDLTKRTLLFVPSIEEADRVTELINIELENKGIPFRAKSLHSETEEHDLTILWEFREDNHLSVLVTVNKLNRGTDVPTIENIISLRDTKSKRLFLQQIGRGMRWDFTRIYDYTPSLANLIWMKDILKSKASKAYGNRKWRGERDDGVSTDIWEGNPGFMIGPNASNIDANTIDFLGLIGIYADVNITHKGLETAEDWIKALEEHNTTDGDELQNKWPRWFKKTFGVKDIGTFLERTLKYITLIELQELAEKLGWEMKIKVGVKNPLVPLGITREEIIANLKIHGITNGNELQKKRPVWFTKTFGQKVLGEFLGRKLKNITLIELQELAKKLGWKMKIKAKASLGTTRDKIIANLKSYGITNGDELQKKWSEWFKKTFGVKDIGTFLERTLEYITLIELWELAEKLGWEMKIEVIEAKASLGTTREEIIDSLKIHGITDGDELQNNWPRWFKKTFGVKDIGMFLERTLEYITLIELWELAEKLGWEMKIKVGVKNPLVPLGITREEIITNLKIHGITNGDELQKKRPVWFKKTFGRKDLVKFLGKKGFKDITLADFQELAERLGW